MSTYTITLHKPNGVTFEIPMDETVWCHAHQTFVDTIKRAESGIWLVLCENNVVIDYQMVGTTQSWSEHMTYQHVNNVADEKVTEQAQQIVATCVKYAHDYSETVSTHLATLLSILFAEHGYSVSLVYSDNTGEIYAAHSPQ